jgi:hypothetical protein
MTEFTIQFIFVNIFRTSRIPLSNGKAAWFDQAASLFPGNETAV